MLTLGGDGCPIVVYIIYYSRAKSMGVVVYYVSGTPEGCIIDNGV